MEATKMTAEMEQLKNKLRATWSSGDFGRIATSYQPGAAAFVDRIGIKSGDSVLDVACGTGNLSIPAARIGAIVTGVDIAPELIEQAKTIAQREGLNAEFDLGDAEALPYTDSSFDKVISMFGAMFAPRPELVASELKRVCRSGGIVAMANWTPSGFIGQMFKLTGKHLSPPAGMPSPLLWGDIETVQERFAEGVSDLKLTPRMIDFTFPFEPAEVVEHFRKFYGPTLKAFEALGDRNTVLRADLEELWSVNNKATDGTTLVSAEYLEVRAVIA